MKDVRTSSFIFYPSSLICYFLCSLCPLWRDCFQFSRNATILLPLVKSSPAQHYSVRQANSPRAHVQFRHDVKSIDLRTVHKILIQADAKQIAAALRVAQFHR